MYRFPLAILICFFWLPDARPQQLTGFPFQDETLRFSVNWPTGVSLGQGRMQARRIDGGRWEFELALDASVPAITIADRYRSIATADLCSVEFERESIHGLKKSSETVTFAQDKGTARRATKGGGSSDLSLPECAKDALTFLYFTRREMGQGRVPPTGTIVMGGPYEIRLEYKGEERVQSAVSDRLAVAARGPSSNVTLDLLLARDAARTPLAARMPLAMGTFALELSR